MKILIVVLIISSSSSSNSIDHPKYSIYLEVFLKLLAKLIFLLEKIK